MDYDFHYFGAMSAQISVFHGDGTVAITHGGIEMGQGINTKVSQVAAFVLGIPLDMIRVKPSTSLSTPNSTVTGGSIASEAISFAVKKACESLLKRLKPVKSKLDKNATWQQIIAKAFEKNIDLYESASFKENLVKPYHIYGCTCAEVEVDVLTGNLLITRVDILEDTGESLSPSIDVGQVEGAFIMGLGYWLSEKLIYNRENGELLTNRSWNYKPPGAKDIPIDFRVTFVQKSANPYGVLRSKATGEPPFCMSISAVFAIRHALDSARRDAGVTEEWFNMGLII